MSEESPTYYLDEERVGGDVSPQRRKRLTVHIRPRRRRRWFGRRLTPLTVRQPTFSVVTFLVMLAVVGSAFIWVFAPWEARTSDPSDFSPGVAAPGAVNVWGPRSTSPPDILDPVWNADKRLIVPGEPVVVTFAVKNVWDSRIGFAVFPSTATIRRADTDDGDAIHVELRCDEDVPATLETGEELTFIANITSEMSAGLRPGAYVGFLDLKFVTNPGAPEKHEVGMGSGSGLLFAVTPS